MIKTFKLSSILVLSFAIFLSSCVKNEATSITLNNSTVNLLIAQQVSLKADVKGTGDITKIPVTWSTSNSSIATVTDGQLKGISNGKATITAQSGSVKATCDVTVDNMNVPVLNNGILLYYGDNFQSNTSNFFVIGLAGPSDTLYFCVNTSLSATSSLPDGNYKFLTSINLVTDLIPLSMIPGYLRDGKENFSWYYGKMKSPINKGNVVTTKLSSIYSMEINVTDAYGNNIFGTYHGSLNFIDGTISSAPAASIKGWSKIKQLEQIKSLLKFNN